MARLFNEIMTSGEMVVDGVRYAYQFREIRKKVGNAWALIARLSNGKWEVRNNGRWEEAV